MVDDPKKPAPAGGSARRFDWFDGVFLLATGALSMMVMLPLLLTGRHLSGGDGLFTVDQLQYLAWVRDAGDHWLVGNLFDFRPDHRVFLHPGYLISGWLHRGLGVPLPEAYTAVWKPIAVIVVFFGIRQYCRRLIVGPWAQRTAMLLALFTLMGWSTLANWIGAGDSVRYSLDFISSEMWTGQLLMGYEFGAIAVFLLPLVLLLIERAREAEGAARIALASAGALLVTWLQPWQGAELIGIVLLVEGFRWWRRDTRPDLRLFWVVTAGLIPAIYYAAVAARDPSWKLAGEMNKRGAQAHWDWPLWAIALTVAPLAIPALISLHKRADGWQEIAVRFWPVAVLVVYLQPFGTFPYHSFQGLALPLAVLAVQCFGSGRPAWLPRPRWWWVVPVVLALSVPGTVHRMRMASDNVDKGYFPYYISPSEQEALRFLDAAPRGKVLADPYGGMLVPAYSGQEAYVGPRSWSPDWQERANLAAAVFLGVYPPAATQQVVRSTGARYIFVNCTGLTGTLPSLATALGPLLASEHRFGCATVYVLK
ncbi:unannotated protein [freshwater metagenome]|uniref:Unannotated protein n=1 Tax=freshwater metagenome TaxID=449393 RepID=A0A6J7CQA2_9ZZZZ